MCCFDRKFSYCIKRRVNQLNPCLFGTSAKYGGLFCPKLYSVTRSPPCPIRPPSYSMYMLGSIYKLAPFINRAAPFSRLKMEQPFINRAAPFSSILSCSVYKWSCSIFKQFCKTYNNQFYLFKMIVICNCDSIIMKNTKTCISFI